MTVSNKELCEWLREHSSGAYRLAADAAAVIEELERENARLATELAARPAAESAPATQGVLKPRAKGWQQCPRCDRLHAQLSENSALVQEHRRAEQENSRAVSEQGQQPVLYVREDDTLLNEGKYSHDSDARMFSIRGLDKPFEEFTVPLYRHAPPVPSAATQTMAPAVEWRTSDTLEFVRQEYLSSENYHKLRDGGSIELNKRQLTNLLNGAFEHASIAQKPTSAQAPAAGLVQPVAREQSAPAGEAGKQAASTALDPTDARNQLLIAWWQGKRPFGWSEREHIEEPEVYCTGAEKPLALLAVELVKAAKAQADSSR